MREAAQFPAPAIAILIFPMNALLNGMDFSPSGEISCFGWSEECDIIAFEGSKSSGNTSLQPTQNKRVKQFESDKIVKNYHIEGWLSCAKMHFLMNPVLWGLLPKSIKLKVTHGRSF